VQAPQATLPRLFFPDQPAVPPPTPGQVPPPGPGGSLPPGSAPPDSPPTSTPSADAPPTSTPLSGAPLSSTPPAGSPPPEPPPSGSLPPGPPPSGSLPARPPRPPGRPQRPARPAQPRPSAPPRRELRQRALAAAVFGLLSLLALSVADQVRHVLYLVTFALVVGLAADVLGISAARRARRETTARPRGSVAAIIMGSVSVILSLLAVVVVTYSQQFAQYEQCMNNAPTRAAEQVCAHNLMHAVQSRERGNG
jgi:hypothetical protein